jgi:hypothetical protein
MLALKNTEKQTVKYRYPHESSLVSSTVAALALPLDSPSVTSPFSAWLIDPFAVGAEDDGTSEAGRTGGSGLNAVLLTLSGLLVVRCR